MKIIGIYGSHKNDVNCAYLLNTVLSDLEQIHLTCRRPKVDGVAVFVAKLCVVFPSRIEIVRIVVGVDVIYSPTVTISLYFIRITFFTVKCDIEIIVVYSCGIVHHRHIFITVCRCEKADGGNTCPCRLGKDHTFRSTSLYHGEHKKIRQS